MNSATFLTNRPEFAGSAQSSPGVYPRIDAAIATATALTDASIFGTLTEYAIELRTAHILAMGPSGREARFKAVTSNTVYSAELEALEAQFCSGFGVTP